MIYLTRCPRCHNQMKVEPRGRFPIGKKKKCVYCGHIFSIHLGGTNTQIVKEIK